MTEQSPVKRPEATFRFFDTGFHGDTYLLRLVDFLIKDRRYFIETGANVGSTLAYIARTYPHATCLSCEPGEEAYNHARQHTREYPNIKLYPELSPHFFDVIAADYPGVFQAPALFWLDSHCWGFEWPLKAEIKYITTHFKDAFILIDDFQVPHSPQFAFHKEDTRASNFEYIKDAIMTPQYRLFYPAYTEKTSKHHPLTGFGLIVTGNPGLCLPEELLMKEEETK